MNRRSFARSLAASAAAFAFPPDALFSQTVPRFVIGIALPSGHEDSLTGATLGIQEAVRSASLFGKSISSGAQTWKDESDAPSAIASLVKSSRINAVVGGGSEMECDLLSAACKGARIPFINVVCRSDGLRRSKCVEWAYHVEASDAMYASAEKLSSEARAPNGSACHIELWHSSLERYGASQLNDRYRAAVNRNMTGPAWAAWMGVKILAETYFRSGATDSRSIANYLDSDSTHFDGHKGAALSFRSWDHQLRQPLYCVNDPAGRPATAADIPDLSRSDRPARDLLDTLGDPAGVQKCEAIQ